MRAEVRMLTLALSLAVAAPALAGGLNLPPIESAQLDNGIEVQMSLLPTVPMVAVEIWLSTGAIDDPAGQEGLAALVAEALRKGAGERDATAFASAMDFLGARFGSSVGVEYTRLRLSLLSRDLAAGLDLVADAILRPQLTDEEILKLRDQMAEQVASDKENPRNVLGTYHLAHVFGDHPYGRPVDGTETSLPTITPDAVREFHRRNYTAERMQITVVGDLDVAATQQLLAERFGEVARSGEVMVRETHAVPAPAATVLIVNKPDTPQTWFRIGTTGPSWQDLDDYAATEIVRTVFGGRFTSWLNTSLRIESGLTYGATYRMWRGGQSGEADISSFTATATTRETIDLALAQLARLHADGLSESDLASAKAYLRGQLPYDYETATSIAAELARMRFYGIGREQVDGLFDAIDAVTLEDCRSAIDRWFAADQLRFTAIGVASEIQDTMAAFGPVTIRENSAPGFGATTETDHSR